MLALGIIIGILLSFLAIALGRAKQGKIEHFLNTLESKMSAKAEFFDSGTTEEDAEEALYEQNKSKGLDTEM